jgi:hypothetical protein
MLTTAFSRYINNYRGFTKEIWILTLILSIAPAPWFCHFIQVFKRRFELILCWSRMDHGRFGSGSMLGSWLGGKLSDKIGFTESWFQFIHQRNTCFSYNTYEVFGIVRGMFIIMTVWICFVPRCLSPGHLFKTGESHQVVTLVRLGGLAGPA